MALLKKQDIQEACIQTMDQFYIFFFLWSEYVDIKGKTVEDLSSDSTSYSLELNSQIKSMSRSVNFTSF